MNKFTLYFKGILMGACDIIPGVSGGSIALITGIYSNLIDAIQSVDKDVIKYILSGKIIRGLKRIHWHFLLPLVAGILTAIFSMARLMNYLLEEQTLYTWSVFFGLILASAFVLSKQFKMNPIRFINIIIGTILSFIIVGLVPVTTPNDLWFIFICGAIAICAMILPGISGAFLLLVLGKYHYITGLVKDPFFLEHIVILLVFALGCLTGIMFFSRLLKYVLSRWYAGTIAFLTGMMLGSLRKIWPYKEAIDTTIVDGKLVVLKERLIFPWQFDGNFMFSLSFILLGIVFIMIINYLTSKKS